MKYIYFFGLLFILISCKKNVEADSPEKLFENYKESVVLISSQFYYEIDFDGSKLYYSPSSEKKLFFTKEEILQNLSSSTGTGFIISENGEIITNRHVVNPKDENFKDEINNFRNNMRIVINEELVKYRDTLDRLKNYYSENSNYMDEYENEKIKTVYNQYLEKVKELNFEDYTFQYSDINKSTAKVIITKISIAFNDTHVTNSEDLQECVIIKISDKENVDLALIQTKNKNFNIRPKNIFNFKDNNPNLVGNPNETTERNIKNPVKINEDVYMIGFNRGFSLATTKQGIKSQFTSGKISQESDGERILYTIPTLEGSSGSPIIDKWGNLVGVNFAKITNSQSFSFGVPVYEVKKFYEEEIL